MTAAKHWWLKQRADDAESSKIVKDGANPVISIRPVFAGVSRTPTMKHTSIFSPQQIAPCGMNCGACSAYLAFSHGIPRKRGAISHCSGCRARNKSCAYLKGACKRLSSGRVSFCYECREFPCQRLRSIDRRYRTIYGTSLIDNLVEIRDLGMGTFLKNQTDRYLCPKCGQAAVSIHNRKCFRCDRVKAWNR